MTLIEKLRELANDGGIEQYDVRSALRLAAIALEAFVVEQRQAREDLDICAGEAADAQDEIARLFKEDAGLRVALAEALDGWTREATLWPYTPETAGTPIRIDELRKLLTP